MNLNSRMAEGESIDCNVMLVGAGVVGRAIALDHVRAGIPVWMADRDASTLSQSCDWVLQRSESTAESASPWGARVDMPMVFISPDQSVARSDSEVPRWLLIESIAESLAIKQAFFADAETWFQRAPILTSNTSTLSIEKISLGMQRPELLCGLHFFMPVVDRPAAEIIASPATDPTVADECRNHASRLNKHALLVQDGPGFVVNRMLSPYLNLSMWLLCGGVDESLIKSAALDYGMPMSPFELIDLIGPRTAFDGGRTVWQAFPHRMDPSPLLPALVKRKLTGVQGGRGFYAYDLNGNRAGEGTLTAKNSKEKSGESLPRGLTAEVAELVKRYEHDDFAPARTSATNIRHTVEELFAAVFHWEAIAIAKDRVADAETIAMAMRHGLQWRGSPEWNDDQDGPESVLSVDKLQQIATDFPHLKSVQEITS